MEMSCLELRKQNLTFSSFLHYYSTSSGCDLQHVGHITTPSVAQIILWLTRILTTTTVLDLQSNIVVSIRYSYSVVSIYSHLDFIGYFCNISYPVFILTSSQKPTDIQFCDTGDRKASNNHILKAWKTVHK